METLQPLTRGISTRDLTRSAAVFCDRGTYLGTDCGIEGKGMWHSLSGLLEDKGDCLDLVRCFPLVRAEYQASCLGVKIRAKGAGVIRLELKSPDGSVQWWGSEEVPLGNDWHELDFSWDPTKLRKVKSLHWTAEADALIHIDALSLKVDLPELSLAEELFLLSYVKAARLYSPERGLVAERAPRLTGERDSVAASGMFCLATSVVCAIGMVKQSQAQQILHKVQASVLGLPTAKGLVPAAVCVDGGRARLCEHALYGSLDTSVYYHSMLVAAQLLWDGRALAGLTRAVSEIDFAVLRDAEGLIVTGIQADRRTPSDTAWRDWCAETALVLLLEHMCTGEVQTLRLGGVGTAPGGVGLSAELGSIFYRDFSTADPDAVTGADWLGARRALLEAQVAYFPRKHRRSAAARLGLYGLSRGEDPRGEGLTSGGTRLRERHEILRPHYILMSGLVDPDPEPALEVLATLKAQGLFQPWGLVSGFSRDLEHLPLVGSFSAVLEALAAYHLVARVKEEPDRIYEAIEYCGLLREAIRAFYPPDDTW